MNAGYIVAAAAIIATPGADGLLALATALSSGKRSALAAVAHVAPDEARDPWSVRAHQHFPQGSNGEYDFPGGWSPVFQRGQGAAL